jgi:glycosyltransferase involved in cell wall biosynthesis
MKVILCVPTLKRPYQQLLDSIKAAIPLLDDAGIEHGMVSEIGNPYVSQARNVMLRKALDAKADSIVFLDHDISFPPEALLKLIQTDDPVVAGTYRFKQDEEKYMGTVFSNAHGTPAVRKDGCIKAEWVPAGFLKVTEGAIHQFIGAYPHLCYGKRYAPHIDLFNHGAHNGIWYGEDYAFSRNWGDCGGSIWLIPDLDITHHSADKAYPGNFHNFLRRQPGGDLA